MDSDFISHMSGFLIDLNGVVYQDEEAIEGAADMVHRIKAAGKGCLFCTNTTTRSKSTLLEKLQELGIPAEYDDIFGVTSAAVDILEREDVRRVWLVMNEDTRRDFAQFQQDLKSPEWIVVGEIGSDWSYGLLNAMFHRVLDGARLLALHKGKYWRTQGELRLSVGSFMAALEHATGVEAMAVGKPTRGFYRSALGKLGLPAAGVAMIGDDITSDVGGAQALGMRGILVRTGKYREDIVSRSDVTPDLVIDSLAKLPLQD
ncbi:TIGR01458 family HAD-type hydrolase [candidate division GN15 bacterium]|nr:TIGR01458 family HAD-type hydrolase [candidate division GN15 bacterium]